MKFKIGIISYDIRLDCLSFEENEIKREKNKLFESDSIREHLGYEIYFKIQCSHWSTCRCQHLLLNHSIIRNIAKGHNSEIIQRNK